MEERRIRVFVSATSDLEPEREVVGETLARFPAPLPWEIKRTSHPGEQYPGQLEDVRRADLFLVLLGQDITAPVGAEVETAASSGLGILALAKETSRTPAGQFFRHTSDIQWLKFTGPADLREVLLERMVNRLLTPPLAYRLLPEELAILDRYLREQEEQRKAKEEPILVDGRRTGGAEDGAIIVAPSRKGRRS